MSIQGVVFDFDNTIATLDASTLLRHPFMSTRLKEMKDICDIHRGFRLSCFHRQISKATHTEFISQHDHYASQLYQKNHINRGVLEIITYCDTHNIPRAVLSDHPCLEKLHAVGLASGWSAVVHCRTYRALKPLPDALYSISVQLGIAPSSLLMIGDRWDTDAMMAFLSGANFMHSADMPHALQRFHEYKN